MMPTRVSNRVMNEIKKRDQQAFWFGLGLGSFIISFVLGAIYIALALAGVLA